MPDYKDRIPGHNSKRKQPYVLGSSNGHLSCDMPVIIMHIFTVGSKNFKLELSAKGEKMDKFPVLF